MTWIPMNIVECETCRNFGNTSTCHGCMSSEYCYYAFYEYDALRAEAWKKRKKEEVLKPKNKLNAWKVAELLSRE